MKQLPTPDAQTAFVSIEGPTDVTEGDTTTPYTVSISQAPKRFNSNIYILRCSSRWKQTLQEYQV